MGKKIEKAIEPTPMASKVKTPVQQKTVTEVKESAAKKASSEEVAPTSAGSKLETAPKAAKSPTKKKPSHEETQMQAYFVAERRQKLGLPGNEASDWAEAERQLLASK